MEVLLVVLGIFAAYVIYIHFTQEETNKNKNEPPSDTPVQIKAESLYIESNEKKEFYNDKDNWERFNFYGAEMLPAKGSYRITYLDQRGLTTERDISIKRAYNDNNSFAVDAMCHLRGAHRAFIDDRIQHAVDTDTGELVESVAKHAIKQYEDTDIGKMWKAIGSQSVYLYVLSYICRADGRMLKPEREILADFIKRRCPSVTFINNELDTAIKTLGYPDYKEFKRLVIKMREEDIETLKDITDCAKRIVATQKKVDPMEKAALETLENALKNI